MTLPKQIVQANKESDNEEVENCSVERAKENDNLRRIVIFLHIINILRGF